MLYYDSGLRHVYSGKMVQSLNESRNKDVTYLRITECVVECVAREQALVLID